MKAHSDPGLHLNLAAELSEGPVAIGDLVSPLKVSTPWPLVVVWRLLRDRGITPPHPFSRGYATRATGARAILCNMSVLVSPGAGASVSSAASRSCDCEDLRFSD